jgi:sugar phosphate isomerase/epimerase
MCQELLDMGFDHVELGHGIRLSLMEGVQRMFDKGKVRFSSLHNFCPLPIEITRASPDCYKLSSSDDRERERALKFSFQTIDFAVRLEAKFIVMHLGRSPIDGYTEKLVRMAEVGLGQSRQYVQTKLECVRNVRRSRTPISGARRSR